MNVLHVDCYYACNRVCWRLINYLGATCSCSRVFATVRIVPAYYSQSRQASLAMRFSGLSITLMSFAGWWNDDLAPHTHMITESISAKEILHLMKFRVRL